jgi:hypothetical protein
MSKARSSLPSRGAVPHLPEGVTVNGHRCAIPRCRYLVAYRCVCGQRYRRNQDTGRMRKVVANAR